MSTPRGPVSLGEGGSWRASWRKRDPGLGCIAARPRSRLSGRVGGRRPEDYTGAETSHKPASAEAQSTPAPSAPGWQKEGREDGSMPGLKQLPATAPDVWWSFLMWLLPDTVPGGWPLLSGQQWTARCWGMRWSCSWGPDTSLLQCAHKTRLLSWEEIIHSEKHLQIETTKPWFLEVKSGNISIWWFSQNMKPSAIPVISTLKFLPAAFHWQWKQKLAVIEVRDKPDSLKGG